MPSLGQTVLSKKIVFEQSLITQKHDFKSMAIFIFNWIPMGAYLSGGG